MLTGSNESLKEQNANTNALAYWGIHLKDKHPQYNQQSIHEQCT